MGLSQLWSELQSQPLWLRLLIAALATWRLSSLLVNEDGPNDLLQKLRDRLGVYMLGTDDRPLSNVGRLFACVWCMSVWMGLLMAVVAMTPLWILTIPFALSAVAILIQVKVKP